MMRNSMGILVLMLVFASVLPTACRGTAPKEALATVAIVGTIESMDETRWVVGGQTISVNPQILAGTSFQVGDAVQVDVVLLTDGSFSAKRIVSQTMLNVLARNDNGN